MSLGHDGYEYVVFDGSGFVMGRFATATLAAAFMRSER